MMTPSNSKAVYFVDGYCARDELIGLVAYLHELKESRAEFSRFYSIKAGEWAHLDINSQVVSLVFNHSTPSWWMLGKRGEVTIFSPDDVTTEQITGPGTGPGKFGYVDSICEIDNELYVCGYQRQVYVRSAEGWKRFDQDIRASGSEFGIGFTNIAGNSKNDIYAVGRRGEIFHFNGERWSEAGSPTNVHLRDVICVAEDLVYISGNDGVLLRGHHNNWEVIRDEDFTHHLWGVAHFDDQVFVTSSRGLATLDEHKFRVIETGFSSPTNGYRFARGEGVLWSIGTDEILRFDGDDWTLFECPDNT